MGGKKWQKEKAIKSFKIALVKKPETSFYFLFFPLVMRSQVNKFQQNL